jgi:D-alanyl-D-alanine carboxypeptidase
MRITVRDLMYSVLLKSANDAAMALAAHHPFGYEHFVQLMNEKARSLGALQTQLRNPHGLDQVGHVSSAWDMALFARQLLADPVLADIVATHTHRMTLAGRYRIFDNHNKLLNRYEGTVGVKTGFTAQAGHCLIAAARTAEGTMLTVVLSSQDHYADSIALFEHGKAATLRTAAGGGPAAGRPLAAPPPAPGEDGAFGSIPGLDPRDDVRWIVVMLVLAALTAATLGFRRAHPLRRAADVHAWLEPLVPPSERS